MNNLEIKVLSLIINEVGHLTIRRDNQYYRLQLIIKNKDLPNLFLNYFINDVNINTNSYFLYDSSNERYYCYGSKVIELLELINNELLSGSRSLLKNRAYKIMQHKELFTRSKGKKLTQEELSYLEQLYQEFNAKTN